MFVAVVVIKAAILHSTPVQVEVFQVDRPFRYYIKYGSQHITLLEGHVVEPKV